MVLGVAGRADPLHGTALVRDGRGDDLDVAEAVGALLSRTRTTVSSGVRSWAARRQARPNQSRSLGCRASIHEVPPSGCQSLSLIPLPARRVTTPSADSTQTDCGTASMSAA